METLYAILLYFFMLAIARIFFFQIIWLITVFVIIGFVIGFYFLITKVGPLALYKHDFMAIIAIIIAAFWISIEINDAITSKKAKKDIEDWLTLQGKPVPTNHNGLYNLSDEDWKKFATWKRLRHSK